MAFRNSLISEDQLLCPICLGVFVHPVSTPCGHNFCMSCIMTYWDSALLCLCPVCKELFAFRPLLKVNTFISEVTSQFLSLHAASSSSSSSDQSWSPGGRACPGSGAVLCDVCTDLQQEAAWSCLQCLTSYCELHLEPHHRAAGLKRHTLIKPLSSLEDRVCPQHGGLVALFCKTDMALLCHVCARSHVRHDVVSTQQAHAETRVLLAQLQSRAQQMVQERLQKIGAVRASVAGSTSETKGVIRDILEDLRDLTALVLKIQGSITELIEEMERKQKVADEEAAGFVSSVEAEIVALREAGVRLEELQHTKDPFQFLQKFGNKSALPRTMDLSTFALHRHVEMERVWKSVSKSVSLLQMLLRFSRTRLTICSSYLQNVSRSASTAPPPAVAGRAGPAGTGGGRVGVDEVGQTELCHSGMFPTEEDEDEDEDEDEMI